MPLCQAAANAIENFFGQKNGENFADAKPMTTANLIGVVIYICVVLFLGRYLWDEVLCKVVTFCKPMPSLLHLVGLLVLLDLLHPMGCGCKCSA